VAAEPTLAERAGGLAIPGISPIRLTLWLEKIPGEGEDAPPLVERLAGGATLLGVFDGLGGAGAQTVVLPDGEQRSEAYMASRLVRETCRDYFSNQPFRIVVDSVTLVRDLKRRLDSALQAGAGGVAKTNSRLRGTMVSRLPTTMALAYAREDGDGVPHVLVIWSGDSRIYRLAPRTGLAQLTEDDLQVAGDAFANLTYDSPMSNYITAGRRHRLNYREARLGLPCVLLAATDGCYDYLPTPMHWEYLLLATLLRNNTVDDWQRDLEQRLRKVAGDDVSLALVGLGFESLGGLKMAMARRFATLNRDYIAPLQEGASGDGNGSGDYYERVRRQRALGRSLWQQYKLGYEWDGLPIKQEG
jgi:serine/threonine protein phosphatase PrpC